MFASCCHFFFLLLSISNLVFNLYKSFLIIILFRLIFIPTFIFELFSIFVLFVYRAIQYGQRTSMIGSHLDFIGCENDLFHFIRLATAVSFQGEKSSYISVFVVQTLYTGALLDTTFVKFMIMMQVCVCLCLCAKEYFLFAYFVRMSFTRALCHGSLLYDKFFGLAMTYSGWFSLPNSVEDGPLYHYVPYSNVIRRCIHLTIMKCAI